MVGAKSGSNTCSACGEHDPGMRPCNGCGALVCYKHLLPEDHDCDALTDEGFVKYERIKQESQWRQAQHPKPMDPKDMGRLGSIPKPEFESSPDVNVDGSVNYGPEEKPEEENSEPSGLISRFLGLFSR